MMIEDMRRKSVVEPRPLRHEAIQGNGVGLNECSERLPRHWGSGWKHVELDHVCSGSSVIVVIDMIDASPNDCLTPSFRP